jgi:hypothetical protein
MQKVREAGKVVIWWLWCLLRPRYVLDGDKRTLSGRSHIYHVREVELAPRDCLFWSLKREDELNISFATTPGGINNFAFLCNYQSLDYEPLATGRASLKDHTR